MQTIIHTQFEGTVHLLKMNSVLELSRGENENQGIHMHAIIYPIHACNGSTQQTMAVTEDVGYSSSLVDTMTLFHNMVVFWKNLKWPDPEEAYSCSSALTIVSQFLNLSLICIHFLLCKNVITSQ